MTVQVRRSGVSQVRSLHLAAKQIQDDHWAEEGGGGYGSCAVGSAWP